MIVTVFRSRVMPNVQDEYGPMSKRMNELAATMPGYIAHKGFVAEDGERVTIVEFESDEAQAAWRKNAEHVEAQRLARTKFYAAYDIKVCRLLHHAKFERDAKPAPADRRPT